MIGDCNPDVMVVGDDVAPAFGQQEKLVDGIDAVAGATAHHEGEASINRLLAGRAGQVVVTADSSKVGRRAFARICTAAEVDILVTDTGIAPAEAARLADAGVKVVTA